MGPMGRMGRTVNCVWRWLWSNDRGPATDADLDPARVIARQAKEIVLLRKEQATLAQMRAQIYGCLVAHGLLGWADVAEKLYNEMADEAAREEVKDGK